MPTVNTDNTTAASQYAMPEKKTMGTEDFLKIMITELTNQDPFEPVKNQDLLAQMSSIQQLQSSETMTQSFTGITEKLDSLLGRLDSFVGREELSTASRSIGESVLGVDEDGYQVVGRVQAVTVENGKVFLELDSGARIALDDVIRFGGATGQDILGTFVAGIDAEGNSVTGIVESIETNGSTISLKLTNGQTVPLSKATVITPDTAYVMLGQFVEGGDQQGFVRSYRMTGTGIEDITLLLDTGQELALTDVERLRTNQAQ